MTGGCVSTTVTSKSQLCVPAVQVTLVVPTGKNVAEACGHVAPDGVAYETIAPQEPGSFDTLMSSGQGMPHGGGGGGAGAAGEVGCARLQPPPGPADAA